MNLSLSITAIFVVTFILLGFDIISAFIITLTIAMYKKKIYFFE
jgi:hypothetical protein